MSLSPSGLCQFVSCRIYIAFLLTSIVGLGGLFAHGLFPRAPMSVIRSFTSHRYRGLGALRPARRVKRALYTCASSGVDHRELIVHSICVLVSVCRRMNVLALGKTSWCPAQLGKHRCSRSIIKLFRRAPCRVSRTVYTLKVGFYRPNWPSSGEYSVDFVRRCIAWRRFVSPRELCLPCIHWLPRFDRFMTQASKC